MSREAESNLRLVAMCTLILVWRAAGAEWAVGALVATTLIGAAEAVIRGIRRARW